ncbi:hypothetical protein AcV5_002348 [Taiwanofungus camphoratus]|nr:hypothetical protein AcV5_002348 [Antrodia cinnamomea]
MLRFLRGGSRLSIASESRPVANDQTTMIVPEAEWDANANGVQIHVTPGPSPPEPPSYDDAIDPSFTRLPETHSSDPGSLSNSEGSSNARVYSNGQATGSSPAIVDNGQVYLFPPRHFGPVIYIFSQETFHSMVLCARGESTPDYYISVAMNCFIPSSYITTIQRGGSRDGELVGSFEMGISTRKNTVTVDGREKLMDLVLCHAGSKSNVRSLGRVWQWRWHNDDSLHLSWHSDSPVRYCYLSSQTGTPNATLLASYTPVPLSPRADGQPSPPASLKLFPEGRRLFDDILISALIIERKRLTPDSRAALKPLFN